jgi:hypothetical protein
VLVAEQTADLIQYTGSEWSLRAGGKQWQYDLIAEAERHSESLSGVKVVLVGYSFDALPSEPEQYDEPKLQAASVSVWESLRLHAELEEGDAEEKRRFG